MLRVLARLLSYAMAYKLLTVLLNLWLFPVLGKRSARQQTAPAGVRLEPPPDQDREDGVQAPPQVSLLLPVRNEIRNLPETLPRVLAQTCAASLEVIVLDDGSDDGTLEYVQRFVGHHPHLRLVCGKPLEPGWMGKNWACHQLGEAARGGVLIFTDADVLWQEGALEAVLLELEHTGADLLTVWPRQRVGSWGERLLVPLIDDVLLSIFPYPLIQVPSGLAAAGNGQLMAFRRSAYHRLGGHRAVCAEVLEDVQLARRVKAHGLKLRLALGGPHIAVRMYRGYTDVLEGFGKNLCSFHGNSRTLVVGSSVFHLALYTLPWFVPALRPLGVLGLLERALVNLGTGRTRPTDLLEVLATPLSPLVALPIYLRALRGKYRWKGREYRR